MEDKVLNVLSFNWYPLKTELKKDLIVKFLIVCLLLQMMCFVPPPQTNNSQHRFLISLNSYKGPTENTLKQNYHCYKIFDLDSNYTTAL